MSTTTTTTPHETATPPAAPARPGVRARARAVEAGQGVSLTPKAAEQIKAILTKDSYPDTMYLFVGVKGGGCSGLQYVLDLRDEAHAPVSDADEVFLSEGIPVVCDLKSFMVGNLEGTTIDYQDGVMASGFSFHNPNAKHSCGCGSSYSA